MKDLAPSFTMPPEKHRLSIVLAVDVSASMAGEPMLELNHLLEEFGKTLMEWEWLYHRSDVCVIAYNGEVETVVEFCPASEYRVPVLHAGGPTAMNTAILTALDVLEQRKNLYRDSGISYYRPLFFLLTDGFPTDPDQHSDAASRLQNAIRNRKLIFFPAWIGPHANTELLQDYYPPEAAQKPVLKAEAGMFEMILNDGFLSPRPALASYPEPDIPLCPLGIHISF